MKDRNTNRHSLIAIGFVSAFGAILLSGAKGPDASAQGIHTPTYRPPPIHSAPTLPPVDLGRRDYQLDRNVNPGIGNQPQVDPNTYTQPRQVQPPTTAYSISSPDQLGSQCRDLYYNYYVRGGSYKAFAISESRCAYAGTRPATAQDRQQWSAATTTVGFHGMIKLVRPIP